MSVRALVGALRPRSALELVVIVAVSLLALELKGMADWLADLGVSATGAVVGRLRRVGSPGTGPSAEAGPPRRPIRPRRAGRHVLRARRPIAVGPRRARPGRRRQTN